MGPTGGPVEPELIIFAALAVFIIWKLRSVLGVRVDRDIPPSSHLAAGGPGATAHAAFVAAERAAPRAQSPAGSRWDGVADRDSEGWSGLDAIALGDPGFDGEAFISGARRAYEMIVAAFARGDRAALQPLLSKAAYDGFETEIARREAAGETLETAIVAIDGFKVQSARAQPGLNEIVARIEARLLQVRRDRDGQTIDGGRTIPVVELWTFARDPRAADPNWKLVATRPAD
jgi:predicted lipid-binding transport protein (Tim44 family)